MKKRGFSLVEILVALIIVSVIMAALAPVITKKLASAGITIVGGGSSGNTEAQWGEPRSQSDCDPYNALYIPKEMNGGSKSVCATKYNAGDTNGPTIPATVTAVATGGASCSSGNCCWKGATGDLSYCTNDDGGYGSNYSGCTRTVCQQPAAKNICSSWAPQNRGLEVKTWRLPTSIEASGWASNIDNLNVKKGANGLQLCNSGGIHAITGVTSCYSYANCNGATSDDSFPNVCYAHDYWIDSETTALFYLDSLGVGVGLKPSEIKYYAFSTRCVTDNVPYPETIGSGGGGGAVNGDVSKSVCKSGTYWDDSFQGCKICSYKTPHCEDCNTNTGVCSVCKDGYELDENNMCAESGEVSCGEHALKIVLNGFEYCMTKYNIGDKNELPIPNPVITVTPGVTCSSGGSTMCCWSGGTTANPCNSINGDYSGCTRTVCDWRAANESCNKLAYQNLGWRLPSSAELTQLASKINQYSIGQGNDGLMLCDIYSSTGTSRCEYVGNCPGSAAGNCNPYYIWSSTQNKGFELISNVLGGPRSNQYDDAFSVRCIAPLVVCNSGYYSNKTTLSCSTCESLTPNCKTCHKLTGKCNTCKDGYKLNEFSQCILEDDPCGNLAMEVILNGQKYCMTKYNIGDKNQLSPSTKVTTVSPGSSCNSGNTTMCCWSGGTTANPCNSINGDYSGCKRTVCDWRAANDSCLKLSYQGLPWRLPTPTELTALGSSLQKYSAGRGNAGLMLCDLNDGYSENGSSSRCEYVGNCPGSAAGNCNPYYIWSSTQNKGFELISNVLGGPRSNQYDDAFSVRCIAPLIECDTGQYSDNSSFTCKPCDNKTANCEECNKRTGVCTKCKTGYKLNEFNMCLTDDDPCGEYAMKVHLGDNDYCMTKYNIGDKDKLKIPDSVVTVTPGTTCASGGSTMCCWSGGVTANPCINSNGTYNACNRTVCDWRAGNESCNKLTYQDLDWRLPTAAELGSLGSQLYQYSVGKENAGLMLCDLNDAYSSSGSSSKCEYAAYCPGSAAGNCNPYYIWSSTQNKGFELISNVLGGPRSNQYDDAFSVRCIAPLLNCTDGYYSDIKKMECESCSVKTPNCKKCHKRNGTCNECQSGYHLDKYNMCVKDDDPCGDYSMKVTLGGQDYCMTKYNIGDINELNIANTVTVTTPGSSCPSNTTTTMCCWSGGTTANPCNSINGDYSGCKRTVCDWRAANESCNKLRYQGLSWRLPTPTELTALGSSLQKYSAGRGNAGLMLCDINDGYSENGSSSRCEYIASCPGSAAGNCNPYYIWSSTQNKGFELVSNVLGGPKNNQYDDAFSVRCVAPFVSCSAGKYNDSGVCVDCDKKVANCTDCNKYTGECLACREGFELKNGACVSSACGALAMQVKLGGKDMCMTKYNLGPDALQAGMANYGAGSFSLPTTVKKVIAGSGTCDSLNEKCCWVGVTSTSCDKANGRYSGCSRTLCNHSAAKEACSKLDYLGKTWRLPTKAELTNLADKVSQVSSGQGDNGLMLCDDYSGYGSARCYYNARCTGSSDGYCYPHFVWASDTSGTLASHFNLGSGTWAGPGTHPMAAAYSFRCVSEL